MRKVPSDVLKRLAERSGKAIAEVELSLRECRGRQTRNLPGCEIRADKEGKLTGYAAVFDSESELLFGMFREVIRPGAFRKTLAESPDIRALWNHNSDFVLGRTTRGTLELEEDEKGLAFDVEPPDTQWARDLRTSIERGDISQMSFGFETIKDRWSRDHENGEELRELIEVRLFEVSPVTFPAYPATSVSARAGDLMEVRSESGEPMGLSALLRSAIEELEGDDYAKDQIVRDLAEEARVSTEVVRELMEGKRTKIERPALRGFAVVLNVSLRSLAAAAGEDLADEEPAGRSLEILKRRQQLTESSCAV